MKVFLHLRKGKRIKENADVVYKLVTQVPGKDTVCNHQTLLF